MLFLLFGSSAAGKTFTLARLRGSLPAVDVHDFDEAGVPPHPTVEWRHAANERWLRRTIDAERRGRDLFLAGQTPLGEMLAAPSAGEVRIRACLLDCDDETRIARIRARGGMWLEDAGAPIEDFVAWGRWMRGHAADGPATGEHWPIPVIDTTRPVEVVARQVAEWVARQQAARDAVR